MEKLIDNIHIKRIGYFNLYLIEGQDGDILIDTGFVCMKKNLKRWLDKYNVKLIILTHAHVDHIWNVAYLKDLYNCEVAISSNDIKNLDNSKINSKPMNKYFTFWSKLMNFGMKHFKAKTFPIDIILKDNQTINKYGLKLKIHALPGHTDGSIGISYNNYLFVGDALVNRLKPTIAYQNQNTIKAKKSSQKILRIKPDIIFIGHDKEIKFNTLEKSLTN